MVRTIFASQALENRDCSPAGPPASVVDTVADPDDLGDLSSRLLHHSGIHTLSLSDRLDVPAYDRLPRLLICGSAGWAGSSRASRSGQHWPTLSESNQSNWFRLIAREHGRTTRNFQVSVHELAENIAKIRCNGKIARLIELLDGDSRPVAVNLAATDAASEREHHVRVTMVSAAVSVLFRCSAELGHGDDHDVLYSVAEVIMKRRQRG